jgi:asparagine synthase (glutamine-hydrolysing)
MCGIAGFLTFSEKTVQLSVLKKMTDSLAHRGPNGEGHWISENTKIGFGHRRLSILDLSHSSDQPMHYLDRYIMVFNGEIYNYTELKTNLEAQGHKFRTTGDTEILIAMYATYKEQCLSFLDGMFAFAIYDKKEQIVFCARDRFGEKPFFFSYLKNDSFVFASELKALWAAGIPKKYNNKMVFNYLADGYLDDPKESSATFYNNCYKLAHAHYLIIDLKTSNISISKYYEIKKTSLDISLKEASEKLRELFYVSVSRRLRSDVPVGSSLSGGLDSSWVVKTIEDISKNFHQKSQNTFSAIFPGFEKNEEKYIQLLLKPTDIISHFIIPEAEGFYSEFEKLCYHQDEPFGSASIYVQYKVMQLAKEKGITVLLDGQGADEILAGYHHYFPIFLNELAKTDKNLFESERTLLGYKKNSLFIEKYLTTSLKREIKKLVLRKNQWSEKIFNKEFFENNLPYTFVKPQEALDQLNEALEHSTMQKGLQTLLRYADRNSMAHSREVRLPFLNHDLVDFVFSLPAQFKIKEGFSKYAMRLAAHSIPDEIRWRRDKIGFEPPQAEWLKNKYFSEKVNDIKAKLVQEKILNKAILNKKINTPAAHDKSLDWRILSLNNF